MQPSCGGEQLRPGEITQEHVLVTFLTGKILRELSLYDESIPDARAEIVFGPDETSTGEQRELDAVKCAIS